MSRHPESEPRAEGGRLIVVCGLPGSGKTTVARRLERERGAVRMNADEWMTTLGLSLWDSQMREHVEALQWAQTQRLLTLGVTVVIEWGSWGRAERDDMRDGARELGAAAELCYLEVPTEELWERIQRRAMESPPVTQRDLEEWVALFQTPDSAEQAMFDPPPNPVS